MTVIDYLRRKTFEGVDAGHEAVLELCGLKNHMCSTCTHRCYCLEAYKKDHWCGNYIGSMNGARAK